MFGQAIEVIFVDFGNVAKIPDWHDTYVCPQHLIDKESNCIHFFDEDFEEFEEHDVEEYLAQGSGIGISYREKSVLGFLFTEFFQSKKIPLEAIFPLNPSHKK